MVVGGRGGTDFVTVGVAAEAVGFARAGVCSGAGRGARGGDSGGDARNAGEGSAP